MGARVNMGIVKAAAPAHGHIVTVCKEGGCGGWRMARSFTHLPAATAPTQPQAIILPFPTRTYTLHHLDTLGTSLDTLGQQTSLSTNTMATHVDILKRRKNTNQTMDSNLFWK